MSGTCVLGVSAFCRDAAAALLVDGEIIAAAREDRFTRDGQTPGLPTQAIAHCLREAGIGAVDLDFVGFHDKPRARFERLVETHALRSPGSFGAYLRAMPEWLRSRLHLPGELDRALRGEYRGRVAFADHHESLAAGAFFSSPFDEAAILTLDGAGEWSVGTLGVGRGNRVSLTHEIRFPHSPGLLLGAFARYTGVAANAAMIGDYGQARFRDVILRELVDLRADGSLWIDCSYFDFGPGRATPNARFHALFGGPPRDPGAPPTEREMDLAASVRSVCEELLVRCARHLHAQTGMKRLALAGNVAAACAGNGRTLRDGPFRDIWTQPAGSDTGGAVGAAQLLWHHVLAHARMPSPLLAAA